MATGIKLTLSRNTLIQLGTSDPVISRPWIVRDISRPYGEPFPECALCGRHEYKTYHFNLDSEGMVTVSETIWERLQELYDNGGFVMADEDPDPPAQNLEVPTSKVITKIPNL